MEERKISRRKVLKSTGIAATGLSTISGLSSANSEDHDDAYNQSLFLREKHDWSVHEWRKYLLKRGMDVKFEDKTVEVPSQKEEDNPSSQALTRDKFTMAVTFTWPGIGYPQFDVDWEFEVCDGRWAEDPFDVVEISWQDTEYDRQNSPYYGEYASDITNEDSKGLNGCVCEYDDAQHSVDHYYDDGDCYSIGSYFGTPLSVESGSSCDRQIDVNYYHAWPDNDYSIGWTYGSPVVTFTQSSNKWVAEATTRECAMDDASKEYTYSESGQL